jgi:hypothetical protein
MTPGWWAVARHLGTVALAVLIATQQYYPDVHWIAIAVLTLGILGFQVVPTSPPMYKLTVNNPPPIPPGTYSSGSGTTVGEVNKS